MPGDAFLNGILQEFADKTLKVARKRKLLKGKVPPISVILVTEGVPNAAVYKLRDGDFLIAVNEGGVMLIHLLSKVVASCFPIEEHSGRAVNFSGDRESIKTILEDVHHPAHERFLEVLLAHYVLAEPWIASPWLLETPNIVIANVLRNCAERFVVVHEVAHCLFGHVEAVSDLPPPTTEGGRNWPKEEEFDADMLAMQWSVFASLDERVSPTLSHGGCDFALLLARLDEKILGEYPSESHPSAEERLQRLRSFYGGHGEASDAALDFSLTVEWILDELWRRNKPEFFRRARDYRDKLRAAELVDG